VAVDWDSTVYIAAEPGDYLTIARRKEMVPTGLLVLSRMKIQQYDQA
jgi:hypothetical protein